MPSLIRVIADREDVAMGDDLVAGHRDVQVKAGTALSAVIETVSPEIRVPGWSWVAVVEKVVSAVWSIDHGVQLLVPDRPVVDDAHVFFRYFVQLDPMWLHARLASGEPADLRRLEKEFAPIARERFEQRLRERERTIPDRLLSAPVITVVERLGATIDLHADTYCRFLLGGERWVAQRRDTMMSVWRGGRQQASLRPHGVAESFLLAAVRESLRRDLGLPALPPSPTASALPEPRSMGDFQGPRWSFDLDGMTAQLHGEENLAIFRAGYGWSATDIARLTPA